MWMWEVFGDDDEDLILFDDLISCAESQLAIDPYEVSILGFSGGALFTTVLTSHRSDALSSVISISGGSNVESPLLPDKIISEYSTPAYEVPALLISGGENDTWPEGMRIVDFEAATNTFEGQLIADDHYVVRCKHNRGHTATQTSLIAAKEWVSRHRFGEPSPFIETGIGDWDSWCVASE